MNKKVILVWVLCLAVFLGGCSSAKSNKAIAEVNGEKITQTEYDKLLAVLKADYEFTNGVTLDESKDKDIIKELETKTYDNLVLQKLVRQEVAKKGIQADQKELDANMKQIKDKKNEEGKEGYNNFLKETKFDEAGLREYLEIQQLNSKLRDKVTAEVSVADTDVRKYYDENKASFMTEAGIQISHILVAKKDKALAEQIIAKLDKGADFAALAKQYSIDPGSKDEGGDLGMPVNATSPLVPEFLKAALALNPGEYTKQPVESDYGYHIIKAGQKVAAKQQSFEEVKAKIKTSLETQKKDEFYNSYLETVKKNAKIKDLRK